MADNLISVEEALEKVTTAINNKINLALAQAEQQVGQMIGQALQATIAQATKQIEEEFAIKHPKKVHNVLDGSSSAQDIGGWYRIAESNGATEWLQSGIFRVIVQASGGKTTSSIFTLECLEFDGNERKIGILSHTKRYQDVATKVRIVSNNTYTGQKKLSAVEIYLPSLMSNQLQFRVEVWQSDFFRWNLIEPYKVTGIPAECSSYEKSLVDTAWTDVNVPSSRINSITKQYHAGWGEIYENELEPPVNGVLQFTIHVRNTGEGVQGTHDFTINIMYEDDGIYHESEGKYSAYFMNGVRGSLLYGSNNLPRFIDGSADDDYEGFTLNVEFPISDIYHPTFFLNVSVSSTTCQPVIENAHFAF